MSPVLLRRLLLIALVLICALAVLLSGCADSEGWETKPVAYALPAQFVDASPALIQSKCPQVTNPNGCAVRDWKRQVCFIYVQADAPRWLAAHELLHCAGFNHQ